MIDFTIFNTANLIKHYRNDNIFPSVSRLGTIKYLKRESLNTHQKINKGFGPLLNPTSFNTDSYLKLSLNYSIQSLIKGIMFYIYSELTDISVKDNLSIKFLNLYYAHVFLSYSILQFNGINIDFEKDSTVVYDKYFILIKYLNISSNSLEIFKTSKNEKKKDINHKNFWDIYYGIIKDNKNDFFIDLIPGGQNYFQENNFLNKKNESECRNFYTYNYSSIYSWENKIRNPLFIETIKIGNNYNSNSLIQRTDFNKIKTTVEKEMIYIMGLLKKLSYKKDFSEELLSMFKNPKLKLNKDKILSGIDDFIYNLDKIL
ncbi:hypothetical protein M0P65_03900 [Candidatus Gracilibacteria bacterium]|nr:hypothetical protein [Candidatus Gracilibacteria bacterium]